MVVRQGDLCWYIAHRSSLIMSIVSQASRPPRYSTPRVGQTILRAMRNRPWFPNFFHTTRKFHHFAVNTLFIHRHPSYVHFVQNIDGELHVIRAWRLSVLPMHYVVFLYYQQFYNMRVLQDTTNTLTTYVHTKYMDKVNYMKRSAVSLFHTMLCNCCNNSYHTFFRRSSTTPLCNHIDPKLQRRMQPTREIVWCCGC